MHTVEEAYQKLASYILAFVGDRKWESAGCTLSVYSKMASGYQWLISGGVKDESGGFERNGGALWEGLDAALFLRDNLLKTTGRRVWAIAFTLYPNGKFHIEYDYQKPDGYEETDEVIGAAEALDGLSSGSASKVKE